MFLEAGLTNPDAPVREYHERGYHLSVHEINQSCAVSCGQNKGIYKEYKKCDMAKSKTFVAIKAREKY